MDEPVNDAVGATGSHGRSDAPLADERPSVSTEELEIERAHLQQMQDAHRRSLERARERARTLAAQAAEGTEDGIRDLVDEDGEVDAAIHALVRQSADHAMHAFRRSAELEAMGDALAFGYTTGEDDERVAIGRLSVIEGDDVLLIDWRAPAAVPFYRATPLDRLGVRRRRHFLYADTDPDGAEPLVGYSDEVFDIADLQAGHGLRGEAAILAGLDAATEDQMRSVVATIQAEQDAVVRAPGSGALVVQGGPGTGKTVVALHRAAYLLYDQRAALSDTGVLIVGPSSEFLSYISGVLPSLGESGVISVTAPELYPGILRGAPEAVETAEVKGRAVMAEVLARSVARRQRRPKDSFQAWYGSRRVVLSAAQLQVLFDRAARHRTHNAGASGLRSDLIETLAAEVHDPSFGTMADARDSFRRSRRVKHFLLRHWPTLEPEQALNDLFGSPALLADAARGTGLTPHDRALLERPRVAEQDLDHHRWTDSDVPLLDELLELLGPVQLEQDDDLLRRDELDEFELEARREADEQLRAELAEADGRAGRRGAIDDDTDRGDAEDQDSRDDLERLDDPAFEEDPRTARRIPNRSVPLAPRREDPDLRGYDADWMDR